MVRCLPPRQDLSARSHRASLQKTIGHCRVKGNQMGQSFLGIPALTAGDDARYLDGNGYWRCHSTKRLIHREVWFKANPDGNRGWHVHHIDGNKLNNELRNLILLRPSSHHALHRRWRMKSLPTRDEILEFVRARPSSSRRKKKRRGKRPKNDPQRLMNMALAGCQIKKKNQKLPIFKDYEFDENGRIKKKMEEIRMEMGGRVVVMTKTPEGLRYRTESRKQL